MSGSIQNTVHFYKTCFLIKLILDLASLANLDARNARRNEQKATKRNAEYAPLEQNIVTFLEGKSNVTTSEIASALSLTTSKVSPRCKALVESGILVETDIKIPKVGLRKAYTLA